MITESIKGKFPTWYKSIDKNRQYLVLTNDFDSYYSCMELTKLFGIQIGGFYDFDSGLWLNDNLTNGKEPIFIDLAISKGKAFDNHFTFIKNPESINPNVNTTTYIKKYNGSTLALICALYDINLKEKTEKNLTTLLCLDGWYSGYYNKGGKYKYINIYWYDAFGMKEYLLPLLERHNKKHFIEFAKKYSLNEPIYIEDGFLQCGVKLNIPNNKFELVQSVKKKYILKPQVQQLYREDHEQIYTAAETFYNSYSCSLKKG